MSHCLANAVHFWKVQATFLFSWLILDNKYTESQQIVVRDSGADVRGVKFRDFP
jgi:hypothetical protein